MHRRKIQLVAGTTYSVSLPKEWVKKNNLREKNEIILHEKNDRTLVISPHIIKENKLEEISLNVDDYPNNIDQMMFVVYYLGIENINLFSKKNFTKDMKSRIRKTLNNMSGTEITFEDPQRIKIKVLLDKSKINIIQVLYRLSLIIDSSITNILENLDLKEIQINEDEIDRLFHLVSKIVSLSLIDSNVLQSSRINNISLVPSYFLISKKLENIGDDVKRIARYMHTQKCRYDEILKFIKKEFNKAMTNILSHEKTFEKISPDDITKMKDTISKVKDQPVQKYLRDLFRHVIDIQEEIVNISFYNKLIKQNVL